jgi:hypothetical protein
MCARCALDVASHRIERGGEVYCTAFCARQAELAEADGAAAAVNPARDRIVDAVKRKAERA